MRNELIIYFSSLGLFLYNWERFPQEKSLSIILFRRMCARAQTTIKSFFLKTLVAKMFSSSPTSVLIFFLRKRTVAGL